MMSLKPQTMPTLLRRRVQLARCTAASVARTRGMTMMYEPRIRAMWDVPGAAVQRGPSQKRTAIVATAMIVAIVHPSRPDPKNPTRRPRAGRRVGKRLDEEKGASGGEFRAIASTWESD